MMLRPSMQGKDRTYVAWIFLILYMYVIFKVILFKFSSIEMGQILAQLQRNLKNPEIIMNRMDSANFVLLKTIRSQTEHLTIHNLVNVVGNFVIFIPFGLFVSLVMRRASSGIVVLLLSFALSLCLESLQLILSMGTFDVDDLMLNTAGGVAGYVIFYISHMIYGIWRSHSSS